MRFSFIIPVYKVENYLEQCVLSVLNQTYDDFELILVDDGSPDRCPKFCDQYSLTDSRVKVIHKKNGGQSSARNQGLKIAQGDYIIFLDSDDWWCDNTALSRISNKIDSTDADVILFASKKYYTLSGQYEENKTYHSQMSSKDEIKIEDAMSMSLFLASPWDKVVKKSILIKNNIDFVVGQLSEDIEWCCKLLLHDIKYACVEGVIHVYRQQNLASTTSNITNKNFEDDLSIISRYEEIARRTDNTALYNFLALEYLLVIAVTDKVQGSRGKEIIKEFAHYFYLLKYNAYPRVAMVSKIRFLGYNIVRRLLIWYLSRHK